MGDFFRLKKPCGDCPFRNTTRTKGWLGEARATVIANDLISQSFSCHKTIDGHDKGKAFCAGAIAVVESEVTNGLKLPYPLQIGERLRLYVKDDMKTKEGECFDSFAQFIKHHT